MVPRKGVRPEKAVFMQTRDGKEIKVVAFDLDETFLNTDKSVDPLNIAALRFLMKNGVLPLVSSGRFIASGTRVVAGFGIGLERNENVFDGGGTIGKDGRIVEILHPMDHKTYEDCVNAAFKMGFSPIATDGSHVYYEEGSETKKLYEVLESIHPGLLVEVNDLHQVKNPLKLVFSIVDPEEVVKLKALEGPSASVYSAGPKIVEISNPQMTKWNGIEAVIGRSGISPEEVLAVGDSGNDVPMIKAAGIGVAMKNGRKEALEAADLITEYTNNEKGFGRMIERLFGADLEGEEDV